MAELKTLIDLARAQPAIDVGEGEAHDDVLRSVYYHVRLIR